MGKRVVLVPQSVDGTPRSHHKVSSSVGEDAFDRHSEGPPVASAMRGAEHAVSSEESDGDGVSEMSGDEVPTKIFELDVAILGVGSPHEHAQ